jgi:hypothetical protein
MAEDHRVVSAILGALRFRNPCSERLLSLPDSKWDELLLYADLSHLTLSLATHCSSHFPNWVRERTERNLSDNAARVELIRAAYLEINSAFASAGVDHCVLKGFAQCPEYSPNLRLRFQSDFDLFCSEASLSSAATSLKQLGYEAVPTAATADHLPVMVRRRNWKWRGNAYDPEMPLSVELHYRMWNRETMRVGPSNLNRFWSRRISRCVEGITFPGLNPVDNVGFSALQVLRDLLSYGLLAHKVYELAYFLHHSSGNTPFWDEWRRSHDGELRSCEAVSFCLAEACFACNVPPQVTEEIETLPRSILKWVATYGHTSLNTHRTFNKDALWVHLALVKSVPDKLAVLRRIFPAVPDTQRVFGTADANTPGPVGPKRLMRYFFYSVSRVPHHALLLPVTLYRGLRTMTPAIPFGSAARARAQMSVPKAEGFRAKV